MEGKILQYNGTTWHKNKKQMIVSVDGVKSRAEAEKLVGKSMVWKNSIGKLNKELKGRVASAHGNKGFVKVNMDVGLPGYAVTQKVSIS